MDIIGRRKRTSIKTRPGLRRITPKLCPYCQVEMVKGLPSNRPDAPSRDHIIPLSRGGLDYVSNIEIICRRCNEEKASLTKEEYIAWRKGRASRLDKWRSPEKRWCPRVKPYYVYVDGEVGWIENPINVERRKQFWGDNSPTQS